MNTRTLIHMIGAHTEGEATRIIVGGIPHIPGHSISEKLDFLKTNRELLDFCLFEPRGSAALTAALILPPVSETAHAGFIPLQPLGPVAFSGSTAISAITVLLETGMVPMLEPQTSVWLDTAVGIVKANAHCSQGRVTSVTLTSAPAFVHTLDQCVMLPEGGEIRVDIAFGGAFFAVCDIAQFPGLRIDPHCASQLVPLGMRIRSAVREQVQVTHPLLPAVRTIDFFLFTDSSQEHPGLCVHANVLAPGRLDRSPCGAGSMARLALLHARNQITHHESITTRSAIGTEFQLRSLGETTVGDRVAVLPELTGRAWIYSSEQIMLHPDDPFPRGFTMADTWGSVVVG